MKWLRTIVLVDKGGVISTPDWHDFHEAYVRGIRSIDNPRGSGSLKLRPKVQDGFTASGNKKWKRNGVSYLKQRFAEHMVKAEGWKSERTFNFNCNVSPPQLKLYPDGQPYHEPIAAKFSGFDLTQQSEAGVKIAVEWETGNISSSHRSLNKLGVAIGSNVIDVGIMIVPTRDLYEHLTDRIGNIAELSHYLQVWHDLEPSVERGLLAITVVEHDQLVDENDKEVEYLKVGMDGRANEAK